MAPAGPSARPRMRARTPAPAGLASRGPLALWHQRTDDQADDRHDDRANDIVKEIGNRRGGRMPGDEEHRRDPGDETDECTVAVHALQAQRQNEDAEDRPVEERSELIDDFDQRS